MFPQPRELPAFSLQQSDRTRLVPGELKGHWTVVFLGFTHCPDVCPTTLAELAQAQKQWEALPEATRPRVLFVSVDPERDSPGKAGEKRGDQDVDGGAVEHAWAVRDGVVAGHDTGPGARDR